MHRGLNQNGTAPIIIGGCHRSGTTLLRHLLNGHSRIHCGPELTFLREVGQRFASDPYAHLRFAQTALAYLPQDDVLRIFGEAAVAIHRRAAERAGKPRWADKNPMNGFYLSLWETLLGPEWVWVHIVRNPVDVISSMIEIGFPLSLPEKLSEKIDLWLRMTEAGEAWRERNPDRAIRVNYEDLVSEPERTMKALMRVLGEAWEPAQMHYQAEPGKIEDPKALRHAEPHANSIGRGYARLKPAELEQIVQRTARLCSKFDIRIPPPP